VTIQIMHGRRLGEGHNLCGEEGKWTFVVHFINCPGCLMGASLAK